MTITHDKGLEIKRMIDSNIIYLQNVQTNLVTDRNSLAQAFGREKNDEMLIEVRKMIRTFYDKFKELDDAYPSEKVFASGVYREGQRVE
jgi:hypothetical protein